MTATASFSPYDDDDDDDDDDYYLEDFFIRNNNKQRMLQIITPMKCYSLPVTVLVVSSPSSSRIDSIPASFDDDGDDFAALSPPPPKIRSKLDVYLVPAPQPLSAGLNAMLPYHSYRGVGGYMHNEIHRDKKKNHHVRKEKTTKMNTRTHAHTRAHTHTKHLLGRMQTGFFWTATGSNTGSARRGCPFCRRETSQRYGSLL